MLSALCHRIHFLPLTLPLLLVLWLPEGAQASIPAQPSPRQRSFLQKRLQQRRYSRPKLKIHKQFRRHQQRQLGNFINQRQQQFRQQRQQRQLLQERDLRRQQILQPPQRPEKEPLDRPLN